MATILKSRTYASPLASAPFDRQRDVYILAKRGSGDCRRLWNDFVSEDPATARLVIADVESERQKAAGITKSVDKRLRKAERLLTKSRKPKLSNAEKKRIRQVTPEDIDAARSTSMMHAFLHSADPATREAARKLWAGF